jgi:hypothetical protein
MFSERGPGEPPETPKRLSLQSSNLRVDLEVLGDQWREQLFTREEAEAEAWAVWRDRPGYLPGQQVSVCGWVTTPQRFLTCELQGQQVRVELTPEGAFVLRFAAPPGPAVLKLATAASSREVRLGLARGTADFQHEGGYLHILAPALAGQTAEVQLQRLPIDRSLDGPFDDFEFAEATHARTQLREVFDPQGRLSIQCNSKAAGIFEVSGMVGGTSLYHRWLHLPEGARVGRRFCRTLPAFDQVELTRFGQALHGISREDLRGGSEEPALGMDLDPPGPFAPGDEAVLRIGLNGTASASGFLCWSEGARLISWGIVHMSEGLNGLLAQIPADARSGRLTLSLHMIDPAGRRMDARLGVVMQPAVRFACDWKEALKVRLSDTAGAPLPQTTVLGRVVRTTWAEQQPGCGAQLFPYELPFEMIPPVSQPTVEPPAPEVESAGSSAPTGVFLGRTDAQGRVEWAIPRSPGTTVHLSARDARGAWAEAYFEG